MIKPHVQYIYAIYITIFFSFSAHASPALVLNYFSHLENYLIVLAMLGAQRETYKGKKSPNKGNKQKGQT